MKIVVTGATGNTGRRIVDLALLQGHEVAAVVRDAARMDSSDRAGLSVHTASFDDEASLVRIMRGADVVINAAGNANTGATYAPLVQRVIRAAQDALGSGGRFWCFGGAAVLDIPGTLKLTLDLPKIPAIFEAHRENLEALRSTTLDWSMFCPGPMIDAPDGKATQGLQIAADEWPVPRPGITRALPPIFTSLAFKTSMPRMTIYYEDAAAIILANLDRHGPYACRRVGVALPLGQTRHKDYSPH